MRVLPPDRSSDQATVALVCALCVLVVAFWIAWPAAFVNDDAYFYLVIARRFAEVGYWTFNGIFPTNGVHPLWCGLLSLHAVVAYRLSPELLLDLRTMVPLSALLYGLTAWGLWRASVRGGWLPGVAAVFPLAYVGAMGILGSEGVLHLFAAALFLTITAGGRPFSSMRESVWTGLAAALLFLARLDSALWVAAVFGTWFLFRQEDRKRIVVSASVAVLFVAPYLIINLANFGGLVPVSGWLKSSFPYPQLGPTGHAGGMNIALLGYSVPFGVIPSVVSLLALGAVRESRRSLAFVALVIGSLGHWIYTSLFVTTPSFYWYFVVNVLAGGVAASYLAQFAGQKFGWRAWRLARGMGCAIVLMAAALLWSDRADITPGKAILESEVGRFIQARRIEGATVMVSEAPGQLAFYFPTNRFVATDLLTATRRVYDRLQRAQNPFEELHRICSEEGYPLDWVMWNGGSFFQWAADGRSLAWTDPKSGREGASFGALDLGTPEYRGDSLVAWRRR